MAGVTLRHTDDMTITAVRGFNDILPGDSELWRWVEQGAYSVFFGYGFLEIKVPVLEKTELFTRSIGDTTDIVEKEMYTFADRRGDSLYAQARGYGAGGEGVYPAQALYYPGAASFTTRGRCSVTRGPRRGGTASSTR